MRVCDVLLSLVTTLIDLGLLANCRRQKTASVTSQKMPTPPTSSNSIFASPTREVVDYNTEKTTEKGGSSQEEKKADKDVALEKHFPDKITTKEDKDIDNALNAGREQGSSGADKGASSEKETEKTPEDDETLSMHNTFMDIVIR